MAAIPKKVQCKNGRWMEQTATTQAKVEPTDVRFSIRSLLLVMVPVAVLAAVAGQYVRRFEPRQQIQAVIAWAGWFLLAIGWLALTARKRLRVEKLAGRTIIRLPIYGMNPIWRVITRYMFSAYLMSIGVFVLIEIADRAAERPSVSAALLTLLYPDSLFTAWLLAICAALWWWPHDIRLCDDGALSHQQVIRWPDAGERWDPDYDAVTVYGPNQNGAPVHFDMIVPERQRGAVEAFLNEKLSKA